MKCNSCGADISINSNFCTECGKKIELKDVGKVSVVREKKVFGFAIPFRVYFNGEKMGDLPNDSIVEFNLPYGTHQIVLKSTEKDVISEIELNENQKEVTIKVIPKMGIIAARPFVKEVIYK